MLQLVTLALAVALQTAPPQEPATEPGLAADAGRLAAAATNEDRFKALTALLTERRIAFAIEPFTIEKPIGSEPRTEGRNIVVTLGEGPVDLVIGAHYDAARLQDGSLSKGAVDNAASSAMLVRLTDALRRDAPPVRIRIVWFDMEELGLLGSAAFVRAHASDPIRGMLNFDINAYGDTVLYGPWTTDNAALRRAVLGACAAEDLRCMPYEQLPPSDDRSFLKAGIPNVSLATLPALEAHQLWLMLNGGTKAGLAQGATPAIFQTIHSPRDTPEKLNDTDMGRMLRFARALARGAAAALPGK